ncbi:MAG: MFS transporter [Erysipelotrichales bacterium]|nr:MFS transporter [Erysipelotrichales bacterium]
MDQINLKLNYKRTFILGITFFTILMLWQMYNYYCPLFLNDLLTSTYGDGDYNYIVGIIMAMDNVLALFLLPLFGSLSDKTRSKLGKRTPFIIVGTVVSLIIFPFIPFFYAINSLAGVIVSMGLILVFMQMFRNPAVSLMPDVTPKPLRGTANGIINFVGYIGAIFAGALQMIGIFTIKGAPNPMFLIIPFAFTSVLMILSLIILILKVKENKIAKEMKEEMELGEMLAETEAATKYDHRLTKQDKINLILLIISIFLWFMSFNAVETFWSTYGTKVMNVGSNSIATIVLTIVSMITFIPGGKLANKIGRKWSIVIGLACMVFALGGCYIISLTPLKTVLQIYIAFFAIAGIGWALINLSSYPMVVEMSDSSNVGKYTGLYYTSSMFAQSITPICVGLLMDFLGYESLFMYSTIFMILALIVFIFIKNVRKAPIENKKGFENFDN